MNSSEAVDNETVQRETGITFGSARPVFTSTKPKVNPSLDQPLQSQESMEYGEHRKVTYQKDDPAQHREVRDLNKQDSLIERGIKLSKNTSIEVTTFDSASPNKKEMKSPELNRA